MADSNFFTALGLSDDQARVYTAALELGEAHMQALAKKSGVARSTIYTFIDTLKERGLITEVMRGKRRMYSATHPDQLLEMEKIRITELERALPELRAIANKPKNKPRVTFHEGIEGIKEVYADMLREKDTEIWAYEDLEHLKKGLPQSFYEYFPPQRAKRGILIKSISRDSAHARAFVKDNIRLLRETKFIKADDFKTDINIYGDKVALMSLRSSTPFAVVIEDEAMTHTMRTVWRALWEHLGPQIG